MLRALRCLRSRSSVMPNGGSTNGSWSANLANQWKTIFGGPGNTRSSCSLTPLPRSECQPTGKQCDCQMLHVSLRRQTRS
eukprot:762521-Hanusia_phi.AAC.21